MRTVNFTCCLHCQVLRAVSSRRRTVVDVDQSISYHTYSTHLHSSTLSPGVTSNRGSPAVKIHATNKRRLQKTVTNKRWETPTNSLGQGRRQWRTVPGVANVLVCSGCSRHVRIQSLSTAFSVTSVNCNWTERKTVINGQVKMNAVAKHLQ